MQIALSPFDTDTFGFGIARAKIASVTDIPRMEEFCIREKVRLLIVRCEANNFPLIHTLCEQQYLIMDTLIQYEGVVKRITKIPFHTSVVVRLANDDDASDIAQIARESFHEYGSHYHADPKLSPKLCDEVYARWALTCLHSRGPDLYVIVTLVDDKPVGFGIARTIDTVTTESLLGGVKPQGRMSGVFIYRAIVWEGVVFAIDRNAKRIHTSTQITNIVAQRVWSRLGFHPKNAWYTFHKWFE